MIIMIIIVKYLRPTSTGDPTRETHITARIVGIHNDCFLASSTDMGTYEDKSVEYPYLQEDTKYTVVGGQTCAVSEDDPLDR